MIPNIKKFCRCAIVRMKRWKSICFRNENTLLAAMGGRPAIRW